MKQKKHFKRNKGAHKGGNKGSKSSAEHLPRHVALVGRPNVGKSRLFNRLVGKRISIVHDQPGITRDVVSEVVLPELGSLKAHAPYTLLDTGGIGLPTKGEGQKIEDLRIIQNATEEQVEFALHAAELVCFVVDGREGLTALDQEVAQTLRRTGRKTLLVVNKVDDDSVAPNADMFYSLGLGEPLQVSAEHGAGMVGLMQAIEANLSPAPEADLIDELADAAANAAQSEAAGESGAGDAETETETDAETETVEGEGGETVRISKPKTRRARTPGKTTFCFIGRPNVGKSSLCNALLGSDRLIVSPVAGTTRDAVETELTWKKQQFRLIDTAGRKQKRKVDSVLDIFSNMRSSGAIEKADVAFLVLDALEGITQHEKQIAGEVLKAGKPLGIIVNKWDFALESFRTGEPPQGYQKISAFKKDFEEKLRKELFFINKAPIQFVSATENFDIENILTTAAQLNARQHQTLQTAHLNALIGKLMAKREPKVMGGKRFKVYYSVHVASQPFKIRMFCNRETKLEHPYERYLLNNVIEHFNLQGCPVHFELKGKPKYTERKYEDRR